jgi:hypothetical protein
MKTLHRRTFLKGTGAALALPMLEAMLPRAAAAAGAQAAPTRMAYIFFPNGAIMPDWNPSGAGRDYQLSKTLAPLKAHKDEMLVISGLAHDKARANGDGAGDHARCSAAFLTGAQPKKTDGADIHLGQSVDQAAAEKIGHHTRLPSLELGIEGGRQAGRCDSCYSCAYVSNISWKSATTPMAKEIDPRAVFERLFGSSYEDAKAQAERNFYRQSILDFVSDDASRLRKQLGATDRRKMDEYFNSVREIEQRIERAGDDSVAVTPIPEEEIPPGIPKETAQHIRMMYDLMALAFQTDSTRICTMMLANAGSNRTYPEVDVKSGHHGLSHHRDDAEKIAQIQRIDQFLVEQFAYFLDKLKGIKEGDGNLLDNSMIVYGSGISDANRHRHEDLPVILAGRGGGTIDTGRHLVLDKETPMNNLYLSMLDRVGAEVETFGDGTARLQGLEA